ncbi:23S rRNA (uracil(1939)-C(5))-methyltransferase RlmD [Tissierella sp. Yu-01]|uniref:23S rRNA (uracil(1939)-C(5))-methyltransferase RlmD n=1 Tax=Tissierella sp. Yu-01 TaxID=3035694 RepID=UPI00240D6F58|nr:23S rRNA (uracil(1939)-C(5))-methyltransferase RlmD [Tissierella sp. Yu-01]WFA09188.1 23S rRNA (uracil(1939)-C(5))-methyltransferase RlmD [Tissierella sp. Yu-01]
MTLNVGDILTGEIIDFTHEGNGVIKIDNFAIFVPNGLIGDKVEIKITELKKNFGLGTIVKYIELSTDRNENEIESVSGEIPLVNYKYEKQLEWKKHKVTMDLLKFAGLSDINVHETIGMISPYRYRNHTQIPVGSKNGEAVLGFYQKGSHDVVDMEGSILQPEVADKILNVIREWINKFKIKPYERRTNKGVLRHVGIRTNHKDEAMVILVTATENLPNANQLINTLTSEVKNVISIYQNINNLKSAPTYGRKYIKLYGEERLVDYIGKFKFNISPNSFFQVNRTQAEVLYNKAIEYLELNEDDEVFDIYCGIGTISLFIADKAKRVYGIESVKAAIDDAKKNSSLNHINNTEFIVGKAEEVFPDLMNKGIKGNKVVIDPPRKGCEKEVLEAIIKLNPERVVYVSCNSATMARDVKYLMENGYRVEEVQPVDMFAHTAHVEVVTLLTRNVS